MALIQTNPKRRRYGVAALAGVLGGIVSAIVKFGWEAATSAHARPQRD